MILTLCSALTVESFTACGDTFSQKICWFLSKVWSLPYWGGQNFIKSSRSLYLW